MRMSQTQPRIPGSSFIGNREQMTPGQVRELVHYLEQRLATIGEQGDCAYERAMGQVYRDLIAQLNPR